MKEEIDLNIDKCIDLESCINWIMVLHESQPEFIELLKHSPEGYFIANTHNNFGRWLRNTLELWHDGPPVKYFNDLGIYHADDMSGLIMSSLYRKYHNKELDVEGEVKKYRDYWDKTNPKINQGIKE